MADSVRYDNQQTHEDERKQLSTASGVLRREWTVTDALSRLDSVAASHPDDEELQDLDLNQEQNKNMGYTKEDLIDPPPDGGLKLWTCAVCVGLLSLSTWGINSSYGVFLSYYQSSNSFPEATAYDYALIGSLVITVSQCLAPFVIILMKTIGFRETLIIGTTLQTVSYILASFAKKIWHLYLTQGVLIGVSFSLVFCPSSMVIPTWFLHKRGLANGIGLCGSGLGGVVFSLSINKMIEKTGDQKWALRMLAIIGFVICSICIILTNPRNYKHPKVSFKTMKVVSGAIFDSSSWKYPSTILISLWVSFSNISYTITLFSLSSYAISVGLTPHEASSVTAILNAGQTIGRPLIGLFADKFGRVNYSIFGLIMLIILNFAFWMNARSYLALIVFGLVCGFFLPVANTLNALLMADAIEPSRFPAAFCLVFVCLGILALPSEVIAMELRTPDNTRFPYLWCQVFTGLIFLVSLCCLMPLREIKIRKMIHNRTETANAKLAKMRLSKESDEQEMEQLRARLLNYKILLNTGVKGYFARMFYPIKA